MYESSVKNGGEIVGGTFVPLPALEPVEYPTHPPTYAEIVLAAYLDGEITAEDYLRWQN